MLLRKEKASFTLIELIVAAVILGIGAAFLSGVIVTGKILLKQAQNKAAAMSRATLELDRWTAMSYEGLSNNQGVHSGNELTSHGKTLNWDVTITALDMGDVTSTRIVPYQEIVANVTYREDTLIQRDVEKSVSVTSLIAYPFEHVGIYEINIPNGADEVDIGYTCVNADSCSVEGINAPPFSLSVAVQYRTNKAIILGYNIAIDIINTGIPPNAIGVTDTILTRGYIRDVNTGAVTVFPIITETPIMSQPVINNRSQITEPNPFPPPARRAMVLQRDVPYVIGVEWRKSTPWGIIRVKRANIIIESMEQ